MNRSSIQIRIARWIVFYTIILNSYLANAQQNVPHALNVSGGLFNSNGVAITSSAVNFKLEIWDSTATCLLYSEIHNSQDLSQTRGGFSLQLGEGTSPVNKLEGTALFSAGLFANKGATGAFTGCPSGVTLASGDERLIRVYYDLGSGYKAMTPDVPLESSAYAMVAETLQGKTPTDFVQINAGSAALTQANLETIFSNVNYPKLNALVTGTSTDYISSSPSSAVGFNGQRVTNVGAPTAATDATNKTYVDSNVGGKAVDVSGVGPGVGGGKTLVWDQALNTWVAQTPGVSVSNIVAGKGLLGGSITSSGTLSVDVGTLANQIVQMTNLGTLPAVDASLLTNIPYPVTSVAGRTGAVTLNAADIGGLGTAALKNYGTLANQLVELNASAQLPAVDGSLLTNVNAQYLQSRFIAATAPTSGQILTWNMTAAQWEPQNVQVTGITDLTGDVSATGPGSAIATIANSAITSAKINASGYAINRLLITDSVNPNLVTYANCANGEVLKYGPTGWLCSPDAGGSGFVSYVGTGAGLVAGPINSAGTLAVDVGTTAGKVVQLTGGAQYPAVDGALISNVNAVKLQSRDVASVAPSAGQVLGWNVSAARWEPVSASGGSVTGIVTGSGLVGATITTSGTISVDVGVTANKVLQLNASAQIPAVDGSLVSNVNAVKLQSRTLAATAPTANQVITWNNTTSQWEPQAAQAGANAFVQNGNAFGTTAQLGTTDVTNLNFLTCNNVQMTVTSKGFVGIGTTTPLNLFSVGSNSQFNVDASGNVRTASGNYLSATGIDLTFYPNNGSSVAMTLKNGTGNVGIGTNAPARRLEISGTDGMRLDPTALPGSPAAGDIVIDSGASNTLKYYNGSGWVSSGSGSVTNVVSGTGLVANTISVNGTLNVDVGTQANKIVQLTAGAQYPAVDGNLISNINAVKLQSRSLAATAPSANQVITWNNTTSQWEPQAAQAGANAFVNGGNAFGSTATLGTTDVTNLNLITGNSPRVTITSAGNVGIGTSNPSQLLQVNGTTMTNGLMMGNAGAVGTPAIRYGSNPTGIWFPSTTSMGLVSNNSEAIRIESTGNVGIGTTIPARRLEISGTDGMRLDPTALPGSPAAGDIVIDSGAANTLKYYNGSGWVSSGSGSVTSVVSGTGLVGNTISLNGTLNVDVGTLANKIVQLTAGAQYPAVDGNLISNVNAVKLQSRNVSASAPVTGQVIAWNGTTAQWEPTAAGGTGTVVGVYSGNGIVGTTITSSGTISVDTGTAANKVLQLNASAQIPAVDGSLVSNVNAVKLQSRTLAATAPTANQVITWNNTTSQWEPQAAQAGANAFVQNGNAFGTTAQLGTTDVTNLNFLTCNNVQMTITSRGYVGVGTSSPASPLSVNGDIRSNGNYILSGLGYLSNGLYGGGLNLGTSGVNPVTISTNALERFRVDSVGNVGIGTSSPARRLEISGTDGMRLDPTALPGSPAAGDIVIDSGASNTLKYYNGSGWVSSGSGSVTSVVSGTGLVANTISLNGTLNVDVGTLANKIVQLTAGAQYPAVDGNLISNVNAVKLQSRALASTAPTANQVITWNNTSSQWEPQAAQAGGNAFVNGGNAFGSTAALGTTDPTNLNIVTNNSTKMTITSSGNVGIGTTTPGFTLAVNGTIQTNFLYSGGGTQGSPTISLNGTQTGLFAPTSTILGLTTGGVERMRIDGSGNVGIGTSLPARRLEISGTDGMRLDPTALPGSPAAGDIVIDSGAANTLKYYNGSGWVSSGSGSVTSVVSGTGLLANTISLNGTINVDVGTLANKIVQLTAGAQYPAVDGNLISNVNAVKLQSRNISASAPVTGQVMAWNGTTAQWEPTAAGGTGTVVGVYSGNGIVGTTITSSGTISVDTGTAANKVLQLNASAQIPAVDGSLVSNINAVKLQSRTLASTAPAANQVITWNNTTSQWEPQSAQAGANAFVQNGNAFGTTAQLGTTDVTNLNFLTCNNVQMTITSRGFVGIGTTSPTQMLDVAGQAKFHDSTATGSSAAYIDANSAGAYVALYNSAGNSGNVQYNSSNNLQFNNSFGNTIFASGNIGIGTTAPARRLEISGTDGMRLDPTALPGSPAAGDIVIDSGASNTLKYYNGSGWVSSGSGSVTSVVSGTGLVGNTISLNGTLNVDVGTLANKIVQLTASAQYPAVDGNLISNINAVKLQSRNISASAPVTGQVIAWNGTTAQWEPTAAGGTGTVVGIYSGNGIVGATITSSGTISVDTGTTANKVLQLNASAQIPAVDGSLVSNVNAVKLQSRNLAATAPTANQVITWNNTTSQWEPQSAQAGSNAFVQNGNAFGTTAQLGTTDVTNLNFLTCNNVQMTLNSRGFLGIGTTTPAQKLDINGNMQVSAGGHIYTNGGSANGIDLSGNQLNALAGGAGEIALNWSGYSNATVSISDGSNNRKFIFNPNGNSYLNGGNVGIGTNIPARRLEISGTDGMRLDPTALPGSPAAGDIVIDSGASNTLKYYNGSAWVSSGSGTVTGVVSGTGLVANTISLSGTLNVDVGTLANKIVQLTAGAQYPAVDGNLISNVNAVKLQSRNIASTAPAANQVITWNNTTSQWEPQSAQAGSNAFVQNGNAFGTTAQLGTTDVTNLNFLTCNNVQMTITSKGYVGIGITTPAFLLDVQGAGNNLAQFKSFGANDALIAIQNSSAGQQSLIKFQEAGSSKWGIGKNTVNELSIYDYTNSRNALTTNAGNLVLQPTAGNVGIGTSAPARRLEVAGTDGMRLDPTALPGSPAAGDIVIDSGASNTLKYYNGSAWVSSGSGTVTGVVSGTGLVANTISLNGTLSVDVGTLANKIVQLTAGAQYPAVDGNLISNVNAVKLQNRSLASTAPSANQVITWNNTTSQWEPQSAQAGASAFVQNGNAFGTTAQLGTTDVTNLNFLTCNNVQMTITSKGYVGIGTASPSSKFSVQDGIGTLAFSAGTGANGYSQLSLLGGGANMTPVTVLGRSSQDALFGVASAFDGLVSGSTPGDFVVRMFNGSNSFLVGTTGAPYMTIKGGGNVGIGTSAPARRLEVAGTDGMRLDPTALPGSPAAGDIVIDSGASNTLKYYNGSAWVSSGSGTVTGVVSGTGLVANTVSLNGTINVDVGTLANKIVQLTAGAQYPAVDGNLISNINAVKLQGRNLASTAPAASQVITWNNTTSQWEPQSAQAGANAFVQNGNAFGSTAQLGTTDVTNLNFLTCNNVQMTITSRGNVGIGTTTPATPLEVSGLAAFGGNSVNGGIKIVNSVGGLISNLTSTPASGWLQVQTISGDSAANGNLTLNSTSNATKGYVLIAPTGGNVGIGTNIPARRLEISGTDGMRLDPTALPGSPAAGDIVIDSGASNTLKYYNGSAWVSSGSGTVTGVVSGTGLVGNTISLNGTLSVDVGTLANKIVQLTAGAQYPAVDGNLISNVNAVKLQSRNLASTAPAANQVITWNNTTSQWEPQSAQAGANAFVQNGNAFGTTAQLGTTDVTNLNFLTCNNVQMTLNSRGNLGVGTTSPSYKIDSIGSVRSVTGGTAKGIPAVFAGGLISEHNGFPTLFLVDNSAVNSNWMLSMASGNLNFNTFTDAGVSSTKVSFLSSGNLGIGTTVPNVALDVNGTGTFSGLIVPRDTTANRPASVNGTIRYNTNTAKFEFYEGGAWVNHSGAGTGFVNGGNAFGSTASLGTTDVTNLNFLTCNNVQMTITSRGFVGIGTTSPSAALNVTNGDLVVEDPSGGARNINLKRGATLIGGLNTNSSIMNLTSYNGKDLSLSDSLGNLLFLKNGGNVGVGTNSPARRLEISGTDGMRLDPTALPGSPAAGDIVIDSGAANTLKYYNGSAWVSSGSGTVTGVVGGTGLVANTISINGTLNVDVGTLANKIVQLNSSAQIPAVDGSLLSNVNAVKLQSRALASTAPTANQVITWNNTTSQWEPQSAQASANAFVQNGNAFGTTATLGTTDVTNLNFISANSVRMTVNSLGNIGVGTTGPTSPFHVNGLMRSVGLNLDYASTGINFINPVTGAAYTTVTAISNNWDGSYDHLTIQPSGNSGGVISFHTQTTAAPTRAERMRIDAIGNVGIGTNNPARRLEIAGTDGMRLDPTALPGSPAAGDIVIDSGAANTLKYYNGSGWVSSGSGTVTSVVSGAGLVANTISLNGTLNVDVGTLANKIVQLTAAAQYPAVDGNLISNVNAVKLQSRTLASTAPTANQVITWNNTTSQWEPQAAQASANAFVQNGNAFGTTAQLGTTDITNLNFLTCNNVQMTITSKGFVGVGTSTPTSMLQVTGDIKSNQNITATLNVSGNAVSAASTNATVYTSTGATVSPSGTQLLSSNSQNTNGVMAEVALGAHNGAGNSGFAYLGAVSNTGTYTPTIVIGQTNSTGTGYNEVLRIDPTGSVGIGTTSPGAALDVNGTGTFSGLIVPRATTALRPAAVNGTIRYNTNTSKFEAYEAGAWTNIIGAGATGFVNGGNAFGSTASLGTTDVTNLNFLTCNNTQMTITSQGLVGIGTTTPAAALHVANGNIGFNYGYGIVATGNTYTNVLMTGWNGSQDFVNFYTPGNNGADSTPKMTLLANGNVGIGNINPPRTFYVTGDVGVTGASSSGNIYLANAGSAQVWDLVAGSGANGYFQIWDGTNSKGPFTIEGNSPTNALYLKSSGSLGIGTSTANVALDVNGTGTFSGLIVPRATTALRPAAVNGTIRYNTNTSKFEAYEAGAWTNIIGAGATGFVNGGNAFGGTASLGTTDIANLNILTCNNVQMTVTSNGNVGIGTTTPGNQLQVVRSSPTLYTGNGYSSSITIQNTDTTDGNAAAFAFQTADTGASTVAGSAIVGSFESHTAGAVNSSLEFLTKYSGSMAERMRISSAGNVGIGTNTPNVALDVNGTGTFSGMIVPRATTALRPAAVNGTIRYNTNTSKFEAYEAGAWTNIIGAGATGFVNGGNAFGGTASLGTTDVTNLNILTCNNVQMTVTAQGNVGIGTTTPTALLNVYGNTNSPVQALITSANSGSSAQAMLSLKNDSGSANDWFNVGYGGTGYAAPWTNQPYIATGNANGLYINASKLTTTGNVGIGTTTPNVALDVNGTGTFSGLIVPRATTALRPASVNGTIRYNTNTSKFEFYEGGAWVNHSASGSGFVNGGNAFGGTASLGTTDVTNLNILTCNNVQMTVTSNGSVGIGTTAPLTPLQVGSTNGGLMLGQPGPGGTSNNLAINSYYNGAWKYATSNFAQTIDFNSSGGMNFNVAPSGTAGTTISWTTALALLNPGNVGIGTTTPNVALDVNGTGTFSGLIVPRATTALRPAAVNGTIRYNTNTSKFEAYESGAWTNMIGGAGSGFTNGGNAFGGAPSLGTTDITNLSFLTCNNTQMTITSQGDVGISTGKPTARLEIRGRTSDNTAYGLKVSDTTGYPNFVVRNDGWVGVNNVSPSAQFDVEGNNQTLASNNALIVAYTFDAGTKDAGASIGLGGSDGVTAGQTWANVAGLKENAVSGNYAGYLALATRAQGANVSEKMRINSVGNVGIGTTTPVAALDINGTGTFSALVVPRATTALRPTGVNGMVRYNTNTSKFEAFESGTWTNMIGGGSGTVTNILTGTGLSPLTITTTGTLNVDVGTAANKIVQLNANAQIAIARGTAALPTISFANDTSTGIYDVGTGTLGFSTGGSNRMVINSSGFVGIATTTPADALDVNGNVHAAQLKAGNGGSFISDPGDVGNLTLNPGPGVINTGWGSTFEVNDVNGNPKVHLYGGGISYLTGGPFGIGTTTPNVALDINGTGTFSGLIVPRATTAFRPAAVNGTIRYNTNTSKFEFYEAGGWVNHASTSTGFVNGGNAFGSTASLGTTDVTNLNFLTCNNTQMTITSRGYVGIGTTTPAGTFEVQGGSASALTNANSILLKAQSATSGNTNGGNISLWPGTAAGSGSGGSVLIGTSTLPYGTFPQNSLWVPGLVQSGTGFAMQNGGAFNWGIGSAGISGSSFGSPMDLIYFGANWGTRMTLDGYSRLGIGNSAPAVALDVVGTGTFSAMIVPRDTTAFRPTPVNGMIRYNTNTAKFEAYESGAWTNLTSNGAGSFVNGGNAFGSTATLGTTDVTNLNFITCNNVQMTINARGNVGIGTSAPNYPLHLLDTQSLSNLTTRSVLIYTQVQPTTNDGLGSHTGLEVNANSTGAGNVGIQNIYGLYTMAQHTATGPMTYLYGGYNIAQNSSSGAITYQVGSIGYAYNSGSATVANARGTYGYARSAGTSTITKATGVYGYYQADVGSTMTNAYSLYADGSNAGTIGTGYGLYIAGMAGTTTYGVYQSTAADQNYFAGNVGLGVASPTYRLQLSTDSAAKPGTSTWTIASDERLKDIRGPFTRGIDALNGLNTIYFNYKTDNPLDLPSDKEFVGIRAQDAQKVIPEAVTVDEKGYLHITTDSIIWTAVNAIKELYSKLLGHDRDIASIKSDLAEKDQKIQKLEQDNAAMKAWICSKDPNAAICK